MTTNNVNYFTTAHPGASGGEEIGQLQAQMQTRSWRFAYRASAIATGIICSTLVAAGGGSLFALESSQPIIAGSVVAVGYFSSIALCFCCLTCMTTHHSNALQQLQDRIEHVSRRNSRREPEGIQLEEIIRRPLQPQIYLIPGESGSSDAAAGQEEAQRI